MLIRVLSFVLLFLFTLALGAPVAEARGRTPYYKSSVSGRFTTKSYYISNPRTTYRSYR